MKNSNINPTLSTGEKVSIATTLAETLFKEHSQIIAILLYGSCIRGNDFPMSDIDMLYIVTKDEDPRIQKGVHNGVYIDVESYEVKSLIVCELLEDQHISEILRSFIFLL